MRRQNGGLPSTVLAREARARHHETKPTSVRRINDPAHKLGAIRVTVSHDKVSASRTRRSNETIDSYATRLIEYINNATITAIAKRILAERSQIVGGNQLLRFLRENEMSRRGSWRCLRRTGSGHGAYERWALACRDANFATRSDNGDAHGRRARTGPAACILVVAHPSGGLDRNRPSAHPG
jgi:hypothetical protein